MTVIAITREIGTRGLDVANGLGKRLGLNVVNDELIERDIARLTGVSDDVVHRYFDGTASLLERWRTDEKQLSETTTEEVLALAAKGNVVIRGWGAPYLLRDIPHVVCARICAPVARASVCCRSRSCPSSCCFRSRSAAVRSTMPDSSTVRSSPNSKPSSLIT